MAENPAETFLDTGYLVALEDTDDQNHASALGHWRRLRESPALVTTSYVLDEVVTFFNAAGKHAKAVELGEMLLSSPSITMIHVDEALLRSGSALLRNRSDKRYSLTDCVSFIVMEDRRISVALAFDRHFEQAGFRKAP